MRYTYKNLSESLLQRSELALCFMVALHCLCMVVDVVSYDYTSRREACKW